MSVIDDYLSNVSPSQKEELERIRNIVKQIVPDAEETISYGIPAFKYKHKYFIGFAGFKNHMSIFPGSIPLESLGDKLKGFKISKGTIQFTEDKPVSEALIKELIHNRLTKI